MKKSAFQKLVLTQALWANVIIACNVISLLTVRKVYRLDIDDTNVRFQYPRGQGFSETVAKHYEDITRFATDCVHTAPEGIDDTCYGLFASWRRSNVSDYFMYKPIKPPHCQGVCSQGRRPN